jgi:N-dimethylarginine dimethylaminohydrolase
MGESRDKILMCPPDFFAVDYVINPWMAGHESSLDLELAKQQWQKLRDAISEKADVVVMEPQPELPDMVFTANAGVVYGNKAVASHFMPHERRPEEAHFKKWFSDNGFELLDLDEKIGFEGAGDCLLDRGGSWLWTGYGFRTEVEAHDAIQNFFAVDLVSIKLTDSRFYHIDTCFCPLTGGFLMYHPPAFDFESRIAIESRIPADKRIIVDTQDAGNFACNAVNVGDTVIVNKASDHLQAQLADKGFKVVEVGLSEFLKAGGSAKCLTLKVIEPLLD